MAVKVIVVGADHIVVAESLTQLGDGGLHFGGSGVFGLRKTGRSPLGLERSGIVDSDNVGDGGGEGAKQEDARRCPEGSELLRLGG